MPGSETVVFEAKYAGSGSVTLVVKASNGLHAPVKGVEPGAELGLSTDANLLMGVYQSSLNITIPSPRVYPRCGETLEYVNLVA